MLVSGYGSGGFGVAMSVSGYGVSPGEIVTEPGKLGGTVIVGGRFLWWVVVVVLGSKDDVL